jgi:hypothetical protein
LTFNPPGVQEKTFRLDTAIDGSGTAGMLTITGRLSGTASLDEMGKKLSAEVAWTPSARLESSAEGDAPAALPPPATAMNDGWELLVSKEGGFSVRFPAKPMPGTKKEANGGTTHSFTAMTPDRSRFVVTYIDALRPGAFKATKEVLDDLAAYYSKDTKGKRALDLNGHPGLELMIEAQSDGVWWVETVRAYVVKDRLYQLLAGARRDLKDPERAAKFLDSFALLDQNVAAKPPDPGKPPVPVKPIDPVKPADMGKAGAGLTQAELREAAVAWLRANHVRGPMAPVIKDVNGILEKEIKDRAGFLVRVRPHIAKSGRPTVLAGWNGGFFVFEVLPEQMKALGFDSRDVGPHLVSYGEQLRKPWQFKLSALKIDNAAKLDPAKRITGSVACQRLAAGEGNFALRLTMVGPNESHARGHSPIEAAIGKDGNLQFSFPDLTSVPDKMAGTSVAFVELVSFPEPGVRGVPTVLSNPVATLVTVVPGKDDKK